ncbi:hypothetical protein M404DRAFT_991421 [Pisolithus tinctorius Marx 270]|uniref:Uncharacterized protein n=1 Tax=Pisolithus tinctorius Marx 270 TaxID=870435 RepID=A0A0C3PKB9_PISTI|nr:hypothetical protein M404DRAFT_991421 [Pisolithus tinctorius Marx 270]
MRLTKTNWQHRCYIHICLPMRREERFAAILPRHNDRAAPSTRNQKRKHTTEVSPPPPPV